MHLNKIMLLYVSMILMCFLVSISGNNLPNEKRNTESNNDGKRKLASDNYIILRFNTSVTYNNSLLEYKLQRSISKIDNNGQIITKIDQSTFTVSPNTNVKIYY